jgi:UPF0271 protein
MPCGGCRPRLKSLVDINADVGEGADDAKLMPFLTSVSIACGGHAGDKESMRQAIDLASEHGLSIGAHPAYPDREHFGRRDLEIAADQLQRSLSEQIGVLLEVAAQSGAAVTHIKAHGALYNRAWADAALAGVIASAAADAAPGLAIFCPPGSAQETAARDRGLRVVREAFADRRYGASGMLVPRSEAGAVVTDPAQIKEQLRRLASLQFETMCIHSDNPEALALLQKLGREIRVLGWVPASYAIA